MTHTDLTQRVQQVQKDFISEIITDLEKGRQNIYNQEENFTTKFPTNETSEFDGFTMKEIIYEADFFTKDFIELIRMPDFRKKSSK